MKRSLLLGVAISGVLIVGILSTNPVIAVGGWQLAFDGLDTRITALEVSQPIEIMRFEGGGIVGTDERHFLNGGASSIAFASTMVGIDGTISEVQYKIGFATVNGATVTAKIFKNGGIVGSCSLVTSDPDSSCTMNLSEPVVKGDLIAVSDETSNVIRFDVNGKVATVAIIPS